MIEAQRGARVFVVSRTVRSIFKLSCVIYLIFYDLRIIELTFSATGGSVKLQIVYRSNSSHVAASSNNVFVLYR